jgi:hypothetical protein
VAPDAAPPTALGVTALKVANGPEAATGSEEAGIAAPSVAEFATMPVAPAPKVAVPAAFVAVTTPWVTEI